MPQKCYARHRKHHTKYIKLLKGFSYLNPQGGLNEYGLFIDFTAIDDIPIIRDEQKKDRKKQVVTDILKKCKTVDEALTVLNKYEYLLNSAPCFAEHVGH